MTQPARRAGGIPPFAAALNVLAGVWAILGVVIGLSPWPAADNGYTKIPAEAKAPAITAMFVGGLAATVALAGAAVVAQLAKREAGES
ncbi:hypothetical protein Drose_05925 [Dactylosporangium roseum]|uniref:Uncharacterized protein n=1 Tax=Dactylosporangium roseum TaxID=47989 RepID=A0ABY5Z6Y1_9ACTN|nr:hypothetical protein [Dactylosporangium roseum]UWZ37809.1 hypothetical protein Drose_05925 [Dactylosporangium roseum]